MRWRVSKSEAAVRLAQVIAQTGAAILLPGPVGTAVGEFVAQAMDAASSSDNRKLTSKVERIADSISERILSRHEFIFPPEDLHAAALLVADVIEKTPLNAHLIATSSFNPSNLSRIYLDGAGAKFIVDAGLGLAEPAFESLLLAACGDIIREFAGHPETLAIGIASIANDVAMLRDQIMSPTKLAVDMEEKGDQLFAFTYREQLGARLGETPCNTARPFDGAIPLLGFYVEPQLHGNITGAYDKVMAPEQNTVIFGPPGAGKTAFLKRIFLRSSGLQFVGPFNDWSHRTPLYIDLALHPIMPTLKQSVAAIDESVSEIMPAGWIDRRWLSGQTLLLIDNAHIVANSDDPREKEYRFEEFLSRSVQQGNRVILTARHGVRPTAWVSSRRFQRVDLVVDHQSSREIVKRWYEAAADSANTDVETALYRARGIEFLHSLDINQSLREFCSTPGMMLRAAERYLNSTLSLPRDWMLLIDAVISQEMQPCEIDDSGLALGGDQVQYLHRTMCVWSVLNGIEFSRAHLSDALAGQVAPAAASRKLVSAIVDKHGLLREHDSTGELSVSSRALRSHLASGEFADRSYVGFVRDRARQPGEEDLVIAIAGRVREEILRQIADKLEEDALIDNTHAMRLSLVTFLSCWSNPRVSADGFEMAKLTALSRLAQHGEVTSMSPGVALTCLDALAALAEVADGENLRCVVDRIVDYAPLLGNAGALRMLRAIAADDRQILQMCLWNAWRRFDIVAYASEVLRHAKATPSVLALDSPDLVSGLAVLDVLPQLMLQCPADLTPLNHHTLVILPGNLPVTPTYDENMMRQLVEGSRRDA